MKNRHMRTIILFVFMITASAMIAQDQPDWDMMSKIRHEGFNHSQVMHLVGYLSDVIGPRPTGSPAIDWANKWTTEKFREWGLENIRLEPYEDFGVGWAPGYISVHLLKPHYAPLIAISIEWGSGTDGKITGQPVYVDIQSVEDFEKYRGQLAGKIVLYRPPRKNIAPHFTPDAKRLTQEDLEVRAQYPIRAEKREYDDYQRGFFDELEDFFRSEGVGVLVRPTREGRGDYGAVRAEGIRSARFPDRPRPLPEIILAAEHYNRIWRIMEVYHEPVEMEVEVRTEFYDQDLKGYNVVAEIPGTKKKDEVVMLGGHIDSWSPGTGAADNAAGCAVNMEAVRILKTLDIKPLRTIRIILWSAEEKGWVGSKAYVEKHYGDVEAMTLKSEHAKVSAYFNYDYGHGKIRGIHLQDNIQLIPVFEAWLNPFHDLGATHVVTRSTGGSDHGALDYIGLPAFQWIQDPLDYSTRIHHTNMDVYDHLIPEDLIQSSVIIAGFVYHAAMRKDMLPRKPLPDPMKYPIRR
jgi:hypothetical protein